MLKSVGIKLQFFSFFSDKYLMLCSILKKISKRHETATLNNYPELVDAESSIIQTVNFIQSEQIHPQFHHQAP